MKLEIDYETGGYRKGFYVYSGYSGSLLEGGSDLGTDEAHLNSFGSMIPFNLKTTLSWIGKNLLFYGNRDDPIELVLDGVPNHDRKDIEEIVDQHNQRLSRPTTETVEDKVELTATS